MYETNTLQRVGMFYINDSCKSIDVSTDSKLLFATSTTKGVKIFDTSNGELLADIKVPGVIRKQVQLSYSNKKFLVVTENGPQQSSMKIYNTKDALDWGKNEGILSHIKEINAPKDHTINNAKWGPLDETIYYCTD